MGVQVSCPTCRFSSSAFNRLVCRYNPPGSIPGWPPHVELDDWCSKYESKDKLEFGPSAEIPATVAVNTEHFSPVGKELVEKQCLLEAGHQGPCKVSADDYIIILQAETRPSLPKLPEPK
jgi:hypothetical protein